MPRTSTIKKGTWVQVNTRAYGLDGLTWCRVVYVGGSASPYPIKVKLPHGRGRGQFGRHEVHAISKEKPAAATIKEPHAS